MANIPTCSVRTAPEAAATCDPRLSWERLARSAFFPALTRISEAPGDVAAVRQSSRFGRGASLVEAAVRVAEARVPVCAGRTHAVDLISVRGRRRTTSRTGNIYMGVHGRTKCQPRASRRVHSNTRIASKRDGENEKRTTQQRHGHRKRGVDENHRGRSSPAIILQHFFNEARILSMTSPTK